MLERLRAIQTALPLKLEDLRQADDWLRWANAGVQEQLCGRMEALLEQDDLKDAARQIRVLQQEWKKVKTASRDRSEALWHRFKDAQDAVRERCKPLFAKQAEEKAEHLKRKEELCEKAELLADSTDWIRTADTIKKLQAEWKTIGPAFQEKATWERFRAACDRFFTRRKRDLAERRTTWAANLAAKVALCEQVEAIADMPELEATAAQLIRKLQAGLEGARSGATIAVGCDLEAIPYGVRSLLRSAPRQAPGSPEREPRRARSRVHRAGSAVAGRRRRDASRRAARSA